MRDFSIEIVNTEDLKRKNNTLIRWNKELESEHYETLLCLFENIFYYFSQHVFSSSHHSNLLSILFRVNSKPDFLTNMQSSSFFQRYAKLVVVATSALPHWDSMGLLKKQTFRHGRCFHEWINYSPFLHQANVMHTNLMPIHHFSKLRAQCPHRFFPFSCHSTVS